MKPRDVNVRLILIAAAMTAFTAAGCSEAQDEQASADGHPDAVASVQVAKITPWQQDGTRRFPGVVHPIRRAVLSTRANGTIHAIKVAAGDNVAAGTVLAEMEARDLEAAIAGIRERLKAAEAADEQAGRDVQRLEALAAEDLIARNRLEKARVRKRETEAQVETIRAEVDVQELNRDYAHVTAPFDGIVGEVIRDEGSFAGPGQPIVILDDRSALQIDVPVPANIASRVHPQAVLLANDASLPDPLPLHVVAVVPAFPGKRGGQILQLLLENPPEAIQPGQVVEVALQAPTEDELVALPQAALIRRGQLTGVMVVEKRDDKQVMVLRWIQTAAPSVRADDVLPVRRGLQPGERVVLHPSPDARDGQQVRVEKGAP